MQNCEILSWYGAIVILLSGCFIVIPYWLGKSELVSAWNFMLCGVAIFIGIGCFEASTTPMRFPGLQWFEPTAAQVNWYMAATTIFLVTLYASHYFDPLSKKVATKVFNKWPPISTALLLSVTAFCFVLAVAARIPGLRGVTFVGPALSNISHKAMVFSCLFAFVLWYRNPKNLIWLALVIPIFMFMCVMAMLAGAGRRNLLSVLTVPIAVVYYFHARNWRPTRAMVVIAIGAMVLFTLNLMYSSFRHFDRRGEKLERTAANVIEKVKTVNERNWFQGFLNEKMFHFSQQVVHYALLTDYYCANGQLTPQPLNTFKFLLVYPIPRRIYHNKPESLGRVITHRVLGKTTSWGTGVAGQSRYEGGLIVAAMFGYFAAFLVRLFDDPIQRQPTNPFLVGMMTTAGIQIVAWPRGDLSVMTFEVVECLFFAAGMGILFRFLFGTDKSWLANRVGMLRGRAVYPASAR